ncbi:MAG: hypothetical protein K2X82_14155 [Gemmataceae bacterium]|nr:hypothetical protein [Gemmataceae bacterium]
MPFRVPVLFRSLLTRPVSRPVRSSAARPRLSVTPLEDRAVPAGITPGGGTAPVVTVARVSDAAEGGAAGVFRFTRAGDTTAGLTVSLSFGGTATPGADYPTPPATVTIPAGATTADLSVPATDDAEYDPNETVGVSIVAAAAYAAGTPGSATLTIIDNDKPVVSVTRVSDATEGVANGVFRFSRTGSTATSLTVDYAVVTLGPAMAIPGDDYQVLSGTVIIPAGAPSKDVVVSAVDDPTFEPAEEVRVSLVSRAEYTIGASSSTAVTIAASDNPATATTAKISLDKPTVSGQSIGGTGKFEKGDAEFVRITLYAARQNAGRTYKKVLNTDPGGTDWGFASEALPKGLYRVWAVLTVKKGGVEVNVASNATYKDVEVSIGPEEAVGGLAGWTNEFPPKIGPGVNNTLNAIFGRLLWQPREPDYKLESVVAHLTRADGGFVAELPMISGTLINKNSDYFVMEKDPGKAGAYRDWQIPREPGVKYRLYAVVKYKAVNGGAIEEYTTAFVELTAPAG